MICDVLDASRRAIYELCRAHHSTMPEPISSIDHGYSDPRAPTDTRNPRAHILTLRWTRGVATFTLSTAAWYGSDGTVQQRHWIRATDPNRLFFEHTVEDGPPTREDFLHLYGEWLAGGRC